MTLRKINLVTQFNIGNHPIDPTRSQDALGVGDDNGLYAIADGVGRSLFPGIWADLLTKSFCNLEQEDLNKIFVDKNLEDWLMPLRMQWNEIVQNKVEKSGKPLLMNRFLRRESAASTFVGLQILKSKCQVLAVGDSIIMQISNGVLKEWFPIKCSSDFNSFPKVLKSVPNSANDIPEYFDIPWRVGDEFILATDAIAKWLLIQYERNHTDWLIALNLLQSPKSDVEFLSLIRSLQSDRENPLEIDDVSLLFISTTGIPAVKDVFKINDFPKTQSKRSFSQYTRLFLFIILLLLFLGILLAIQYYYLTK